MPGHKASYVSRSLSTIHQIDAIRAVDVHVDQTGTEGRAAQVNRLDARPPAGGPRMAAGQQMPVDSEHRARIGP